MSFYVVESGRLIDEAKRAALDAVDGYDRLTPYTVGVAVQAAVEVLRVGNGLEPAIDVPTPTAVVDVPTPTAVVDVRAVEVTPRLRVLESVAAAARRIHGGGPLDDCDLCAALGRLAELDEAG
jgi:hypothetical protein